MDAPTVEHAAATGDVPTGRRPTASPWQVRARAAGVHLLLSMLVATAAAALVFGLWYPGAYREMAGGRELFLLITSVDVALGPLLTFVAFNLRKPRRELRRDLAIIGVLQLGALIYGLHTTYLVRPVAMVFEIDRLRVVTQADVRMSELPEAAEAYRSLPLTGPWLLGARRAAEGAERTEALFLGLQGYDTGQRPTFWEPYDRARPRVLEKSRPVRQLLDHQTDRRSELEQAIAEAGLDPSTARFLPVMARGDWVALLNSQGDVAGFARFDGFF